MTSQLTKKIKKLQKVYFDKWFLIFFQEADMPIIFRKRALYINNKSHKTAGVQHVTFLIDKKSESRVFIGVFKRLIEHKSLCR